jgi:hypothetical protein
MHTYAGVTSMTIKGDDQMEVVGEDVDTVCLVCCLRKKKFGHAAILLVEEVKEKKEEKKEDKKDDEKKPCCPGYPYCYCLQPFRPPPMVFCEEHPNYGCSIM